MIAQSVCQHCGLRIKFYAGRWRDAAGKPFCDNQCKVEHEPKKPAVQDVHR